MSKKHLGVLAGAMLAIAAAVPLAFYSGIDLGFGARDSGWTNPFSTSPRGAGLAANAGAKATPIQRLMAMLDARSPGERTTAELAATKQRMLSERRFASNPVPRQRALGKVIQPTTVPSQQFANALTPPPLTPIVSGGLAVPALADALTPIPAAFTPIVGGVLIPPVGGGFGGGGGGGVVPPIVPPVLGVTPAVPEPTTWLMMLLGFGMIGGAMRRRGVVAAAVPV